MNIDDLEEMLNNRIIAAYLLGFSVVEITRTLRKTSVDFVHSLLRETGYIPVMARSEYRRKYDIHYKMEEAFRKKGFSFGRWCLGWKLDPESAAVDLKIVPENNETTAAHTAFQKDFPDLFFSIYGGSRPRSEKKRKPVTLPPSLRIDWNDDKKQYVASIQEHPMVETFGHDWDEAYYNIKIAYRLLGYLLKLNILIAGHDK